MIKKIGPKAIQNSIDFLVLYDGEGYTRLGETWVRFMYPDFSNSILDRVDVVNRYNKDTNYIKHGNIDVCHWVSEASDGDLAATPFKLNPFQPFIEKGAGVQGGKKQNCIVQ
jgi:hypothetical protein